MDPFIGQIMIFAGNFAPRGWAFCHGQLLPIASNTALFSLFGTTYGGDGRTTFALPDLQGRAAISEGRGPGLSSFSLGQKAGNVNTTLTAANLPPSDILLPVSDDDATSTEGNGRVLALPSDDVAIYGANATGNLKPASIAGAQQTPFSNENPYLVVNYIVALVGTYPSRP